MFLVSAILALSSVLGSAPARAESKGGKEGTGFRNDHRDGKESRSTSADPGSLGAKSGKEGTGFNPPKRNGGKEGTGGKDKGRRSPETSRRDMSSLFKFRNGACQDDEGSFGLNSFPDGIGRGGLIDALKTEGGDCFDLRGMDFEGADLSGVAFRGANLRDANFAGASLRLASFVATDLSGANLSGADATFARFFQVNLTDGILAGARLVDTVFQDSVLLVAERGPGNIRGFEGADIRGATFEGNVLPASLSGARANALTHFTGSTPTGLQMLNGAGAALYYLHPASGTLRESNPVSLSESAFAEIGGIRALSSVEGCFTGDIDLLLSRVLDPLIRSVPGLSCLGSIQGEPARPSKDDEIRYNCSGRKSVAFRVHIPRCQ